MLPRDSAIKIQAEMLREILGWRKYLPVLVEAVKEVLGDEAEVYVAGSAAEGRLTANSDIDVLVVVDKVPGKGIERARILDRMWMLMESRGVPWWYPFEIHLITEVELERFKKAGKVER